MQKFFGKLPIWTMIKHPHTIKQNFCQLTNAYKSTKPINSQPINPHFKRVCKKLGFENLTPIQEKAIPEMYSNKNIGIFAETGSGKTLAYALPILDRLSKESKNVDFRSSTHGCIVLTNTKELCIQVYSLFKRLDHDERFKIYRTGAIGYVPPHKQVNNYDFEKHEARIKFLKEGSKHDLYYNEGIINIIDWKRMDVLVTTPSQLESILNIKRKNIKKDIDPEFLVIDEMDLLLIDKAYNRSIGNIMTYLQGLNTVKINQNEEESMEDLKEIPSVFGKESNRKLILAGASLKSSLKKSSSKSILQNMFGKIEFIESDSYLKINPNLEHEKLDVSEQNPEDRLQLLQEVIDESTSKKTVIFCNNTQNVSLVAQYQNSQNIVSSEFHSSLSENQRIDSQKEFNEDQTLCFVTTDLACRGIDFSQKVDFIIQFDFALNATSLQHRFGRTGRLNNKGKVTSFVDTNDLLLSELLEEKMSKGEKLDDMISRNRNLSKRIKKQESLTYSDIE